MASRTLKRKGEAVDRFLLGEVKGAVERGRVLDLPAGDGNLSRLLASAGYDVTPADLFPEKLAWEGREATLADMNAPLPFEPDRFDAVISQEGVEHLENLAGFFRECHRVLRSGGHLWLTTPNFMDLSGRLSYFLTGMKSFHAGFPNEETTLWGRDGNRLYHGHAFSLPFFQLRYLLRVCGFEDVRLTGLGKSSTSAGLYVLVRPISGLLVRRSFRKLARKKRHGSRKTRPPRELEAEVSRLALSRDLLCYRKICVRATAHEIVPGDSRDGRGPRS